VFSLDHLLGSLVLLFGQLVVCVHGLVGVLSWGRAVSTMRSSSTKKSANLFSLGLGLLQRFNIFFEMGEMLLLALCLVRQFALEFLELGGRLMVGLGSGGRHSSIRGSLGTKCGVWWGSNLALDEVRRGLLIRNRWRWMQSDVTQHPRRDRVRSG
jgi:hypothetical protein